AGSHLVRAGADGGGEADLVVKEKEPPPPASALLRNVQTLFPSLPPAAAPDVRDALIRAGTTAIAYETVALDDGSLPLLIPMSEIAGRMAPEVGSQWLRRPGPGRGKLMSGLPGSPPAKVVVFGAGTVAMSAIKVAAALGAQITVIGNKLDELRRVGETLDIPVTTLPSTPAMIEDALVGADMLISGVLVRGGRAAPKLV